jgi:hypothetical protein
MGSSPNLATNSIRSFRTHGLSFAPFLGGSLANVVGFAAIGFAAIVLVALELVLCNITRIPITRRQVAVAANAADARSSLLLLEQVLDQTFDRGIDCLQVWRSLIEQR